MKLMEWGRVYLQYLTTAMFTGPVHVTDFIVISEMCNIPSPGEKDNLFSVPTLTPSPHLTADHRSEDRL